LQKQDGEMGIIADDDGAMASMDADDRAEIEQYHCQECHMR